MVGEQALITPIEGFRTEKTDTLVLFLPGMSGSARQWDLVVPATSGLAALRAYGTPILAHPRFGNRPPSVSELATVTAQELRDSGYSRVVIVSHSVGAFVALGIARALPDVVARVVAVNGGLAGIARFIDDPAREFAAHPRACLAYLRLFLIVGFPLAEPLKHAIASHQWPSAVAAGNLVSEAGTRTRAQREALVEEVGGPAVLRALVENRHHWPEFLGYCADIPTPVRFLVGVHDPIAPEGDAREMAALLPRSSIRVVGGAAHSLPLEYPAVVIEEIRAALAEPAR